MSSPDNNFLPNIKCPKCGYVGPYAISGFAGKLTIRGKQCPKCKTDFQMVVYVEASLDKMDDHMNDAKISSLKQQIKQLKRCRLKNLTELLLQIQLRQKD